MNHHTTGGGPAFPTPQGIIGGESFSPHPGMTLRDYFAAAALNGLIAKDAAHATMELLEHYEWQYDSDGRRIEPAEGVYEEPDAWEDVAAGAYALADAMLAARRKKDGDA